MPHLCVTVGVKIWSVPLLTDFKEGEVINSTVLYITFDWENRFRCFFPSFPNSGPVLEINFFL